MSVQILYDAPAHLTMPERFLLYSLVYGLRPASAVEIGTAQGGAAMIICTAMDAVGSGRLICIDPAPQVAPDHLARISHRVSLISTASPEAVIQAHESLGSPFDFVFVDGDHTYSGVLRDIEAVSRFLREGSYVLFHDVHYFEVQDAIDEARKRLPFIDCGLLSFDETRTEHVHMGKPVVWGGLRLLRFAPSSQRGTERDGRTVPRPTELDTLDVRNKGHINGLSGWRGRGMIGDRGKFALRRLRGLWSRSKQKLKSSTVEHSLTSFLPDRQRLKKWAGEVGEDWKGHSRVALDYYESAEQWIEQAWSQTVWPFIWECDFSCVVDLAAGHGRNTRKLLELAKKLYLVDINADNIRFCRQRFATETRITYIQNDGFTLSDIPSGEVSLVYCFDAMGHFDSDIIRSYLHDFHRVLKPGGYGFCHHSNYDRNPGGDIHDNPGWRNFMSQNLFLHYCAKERLEVVKSQIIDWDTPKQDCVTLFRKPL